MARFQLIFRYLVVPIFNSRTEIKISPRIWPPIPISVLSPVLKFKLTGLNRQTFSDIIFDSQPYSKKIFWLKWFILNCHLL